MTTLIGIELKDRVILAADSQVTEDNLRTISVTVPKIVSVGKYLLGIVGDSRPGDILAYNWNPPVYKGADPVHWMGKKATKEKDAGFDYLVAFAGNLFHIAIDLSFIQSKLGVYGLGSGGHFALGYLAGLPSSSLRAKAEEHAEKAVQLASVLDVNTHPPIQLVVQRREYK
jgi:ATP-dependent protease HslVU (ClpYQ) peptidase subunit